MEETPYILKVHKSETMAAGLNTITVTNAVLNISLVDSYPNKEPDYASQGRRIADMLMNYLPNTTVRSLNSRLSSCIGEE